jgi:hypothetical protein
MLCARNRLVSGLLVLVVLTRTVFLGYHYAPESRYIVEAYPAMIAACGVTCAILWRYLHQRFKKARPLPKKSQENTRLLTHKKRAPNGGAQKVLAEHQSAVAGFVNLDPIARARRSH